MNLIFQDSALAHKYLDNLIGFEIGRANHNPFNLPNCINVDYTDDMNTVFKQGEFKLCGSKAQVDVVANGDELPFEDDSYDYCISSHVIEHFFDPIKALQEWNRVVKSGGYIFIICPHKMRIFDEHRPLTSLQELINRHEGRLVPENVLMEGGHQVSNVTGLPLNEHGHWSVWDTQTFLELCYYMKLNVVEYLDVDDKVGNGFCVVIQVI